MICNEKSMLRNRRDRSVQETRPNSADSKTKQRGQQDQAAQTARPSSADSITSMYIKKDKSYKSAANRCRSLLSLLSLLLISKLLSLLKQSFYALWNKVHIIMLKSSLLFFILSCLTLILVILRQTFCRWQRRCQGAGCRLRR